jgi:opacity protein-like surface antigen
MLRAAFMKPTPKRPQRPHRRPSGSSHAFRSPWLPVTGAALCLAGALAPAGRAEDADRFRPYLRFHSGDISPLWGVDDLWSFSLGANFNQYLGAELTLDFFEREYEYESLGGVLGEVSAWNPLPYLRLRYPMANNRLVPYVLAGVGPTFLQFNDRQKAAFGQPVDIEGWTVSVGLGGGVEYFIGDNVTFGVEGKYLWMSPLDSTVAGASTEVELSSAMFTFGLRVYWDENNPRPLLGEAEQRTPNRFYFGLRLGGHVLTDDEFSDGVSFGREPSAKGSFSQAGSLAFGYDFGEHLGVELAADSLEPNLEYEGYGAVSEYGMGAVLPYLRLRYPMQRGRWVPYLMAGAGIVYGESNDQKEAGADLDIDAKGIYPALAVGGGIEYFVARNFSLNADARWLYSWGHEFEINGRPAEGDFSTVMLHLGFRVYLFETKGK